MGGGRGIGSRFLLLIDEDMRSAAREAARHLADEFSDVVELRPRKYQGIKLVRPDGYIAYSAHNGNSVAELDRVRSLLVRQTNQAKARVR